jgi:hypothetical protein
MFKPGTNEVIVLCGVEVTSALENIFKDFMLSALGGMTPDDYWTAMWGAFVYDMARDKGLVERFEGAPTRYRFTPLGKRIFASWLLLKESGAHEVVQQSLKEGETLPVETS